MPKGPISLTQRLADYRAAEQQAVEAAEAWLESKASGHVRPAREQALDEAERNLRAAKRRYEKALAKRARE